MKVKRVMIQMFPVAPDKPTVFSVPVGSDVAAGGTVTLTLRTGIVDPRPTQQLVQIVLVTLPGEHDEDVPDPLQG